MARFEDINKFLEGKGIDFEVIKLSGIARSVEDVLKLTNGRVNRDEVIKTLIVKDRDGNFIGCVLQGGDRLKDNAFERLATKDEVLQVAGVEFGAVCPILLGTPIVIDKKVMNLKRVNMGSGDLLKGIEMNFQDLLSILPDYKIKEIT